MINERLSKSFWEPKHYSFWWVAAGLIEIFLLNQNIEAIDGEAMGSSGFNQFYGKPIQNNFSVKPCWSYFLLLDNVEI